jgi:transmembrane sensor
VTTSDRRSRQTDEAAGWWIRSRILSGQPLSRAEREQLTDWLRESPLHISEMLHMARVQDTLEHFKLWHQVDGGVAPHADNVIPFHDDGEGNGDDAGAYSYRSERSGRWRRPFIALAASTVAAAVLAVVLVPRMLGETLVTRHAERREVALSDGSTVQLDPDTKLQVKLGARERLVALVSGRAVFHVAKDKSRPFLVSAKGTVVRAVGTVFGVEQRQQGVVVTVSEGAVVVLPPRSQQRSAAVGNDTSRVAAAAATNRAPPAGPVAPGARAATTTADKVERSAVGASGEGVLVSAGEQVKVGGHGDSDTVRAVDSRQALSWAEGYLVFESTPLSSVVSEFNRYNNVQLRLVGAELARRPISGTFLVSDPETLIAFIQAGADVSVTREDRGRTVLIASLP